MPAEQKRFRLKSDVRKEPWAEDGALGSPLFGSRMEKLMIQTLMVDPMHVRVLVTSFGSGIAAKRYTGYEKPGC